MTENEIGTLITEAAIEVHRELGPGLLESVYEIALSHLLTEMGCSNERQVPIPIEFRGIKLQMLLELLLFLIKQKTMEVYGNSKPLQVALAYWQPRKL